ncbi:MAG: hypothetical protein HUU20_01425 [Pirellulales bacterium]|nr:hypothetical protein [Pirellulales bacterium]
MICYSYNQQVTRPAPFVHVTIQPPGGGASVPDLPALLDTAADTAADMTVIPARVAEQLQLVPLDEVPIGGFDGRISWVPTYLVQLTLRVSDPVVIRIIASRDEPYVLLGREVLNGHRILLDGPRLRLELD